MFVVKAAATLLLTAFLYWAEWVWPVLSFGFGSVMFRAIGFLFLPLVSLGAVILVIVALLGALDKQHQPRVAGVLGLAIAVIVGSAVGNWLGPIHRMQRVREVVADAMPLVRAIEAFERREGRPPRDLDELIPRDLPSIPPTGMRGYSEWRYMYGIDARGYGENSWILLVHTPGPGINFDQLMYFPNQQYPEFGHGGRIERVGAWAYVHE